MAQLNDLEDVTISNPKVGDVVKYTATGWQNGADATGTPAGGNPCGNLDGYTQSDKEETITEPWTWEDAGCPAITVKSTEGDDAGDQAEICPGAFIVKSDVGLEGRLKSRGADGQIELRVNGGQLYFRDDVVNPPVRLAELVTGTATISKAFSPIIRDFSISEVESDKTNTFAWDYDGTSLTFSYGSIWADQFPEGRHYGVATFESRAVNMPKGANGAVVFLQSRVELGVSNDPSLAPTGSQRALHSALRLDVSNASFPIKPVGVEKSGFGEAVKDIVRIQNNSESIVEQYRVTKSFDKYDLINFGDQASVTFKPRLDVLKGGRGEFKIYGVRLVILPFYSDSPSDFTIPENDSIFSYAVDSDLSAIYDKISPAETPAQSANNAGMEYRDFLRRILVALESRKSYPPAGGATEAEFNAQIQAGWELVDNATLQTLEEFEAAFNVYYTEIAKDKYGVAVLFQFELEAGNTLRGLL